MIVCHLCPQGRNLVSVGDPPYGDARRLRDLLRNTPGLQVQTQHLSPQAQAAEVEAWDRGLPSVVAQVSASGALAEAQRTERGLKPDPLHEALATILEERVSAGEPITAVITDLALLSKQKPLEFTWLVGQAIPVLAALSPGLSKTRLAAAVASFLRLPGGSCPQVSERTLWRIWGGRR